MNARARPRGPECGQVRAAASAPRFLRGREAKARLAVRRRAGEEDEKSSGGAPRPKVKGNTSSQDEDKIDAFEAYYSGVS